MKFASGLIVAIVQAASQEEHPYITHPKVKVDIVANTWCCFCAQNWVNFKHYIMDQDIGEIVDVTYNTIFPLPAGHSPPACGSISQTYTTSCMFLTDGAAMCAQKYSKLWPEFVDCTSRMAFDGGKGNPLAANESSFDSGIRQCASRMTDYDTDEFATCTFGKKTNTGPYEEAESYGLLKENVGRVRQIWDETGGRGHAGNITDPTDGGLIWSRINGTMVTDPVVFTPKNHPREPWVKKMILAICESYTGDTSKYPSCVNVDEAMKKVQTLLIADPDPCAPDGELVV